MASAEATASHPKCTACGFHHPKYGQEDLHQKCPDCGRLFPSKIGLEFHQKTHKRA